MHPGKEPGSEEWGASVNEKQSQMKDRSSSGIAWAGVRSGRVAFARPRNCRARAERDPLFAPLLNPPALPGGTASVGYRCLRAYSASNSDSKEPVMRQMLSPGSSVSSSRSRTLSVPIADSSGMLVALRGASQGDEGGRGLCGDGFARTKRRPGKVRSASQNAKQRASASHRQHAIALNGRFDSSSCGDAVPGSSASPPTPETLCPTAFSCSSWP